MIPETKKILQDKANEKYPYEFVSYGREIEDINIRREAYIAASTDCFDIAVKFTEWKDDNFTRVGGKYIHRKGSIDGNSVADLEQLLNHFIQNIYGK